MHAKPLAQIGEVAAFEAFVEVAEILQRALPDLHGHYVAERVRREVAERAGRPVHVLQHTLSVVGDIDAEVFVHARVPRFGQFGDREPVLDQVLLELEAEDDVEVVRELVRVDADQ